DGLLALSGAGAAPRALRPHPRRSRDAGAPRAGRGRAGLVRPRGVGGARGRAPPGDGDPGRVRWQRPRLPRALPLARGGGARRGARPRVADARAGRAAARALRHARAARGAPPRRRLGRGRAARRAGRARLGERAPVALCALQVGVTDRALRMTAAYTAGREQFGRPIASFQAVQQRAADAYIDAEAIRLTTWQAAWRLAADRPATTEV